ncbi:MAG: DNA recombination protein RmuC [Anaeromyxobacter sp.]
MDLGLVVGVLAALAAGVGAGLFAARQGARAREAHAADLSARLSAAEARGAEAQGQVVALTGELAAAKAALGAERQGAQARAAEAERAREQVRAEIQLLAARLLDEKGRALLDRNHEALQQLLAPVAEKLRAFEAKVEKAYDQENRDRASLLQSLAQLRETQGKLHADAEGLARALTGDSKAQGDWGELVLERVLEIAGLTEGREFDLQVSHDDEAGGRKRPDALVYLPGRPRRGGGRQVLAHRLRGERARRRRRGA